MDAKEFPGSDPATLGKALPMEMVRPRRIANAVTVSRTLERFCERWNGFPRTLERFRQRRSNGLSNIGTVLQTSAAPSWVHEHWKWVVGNG